MKSLNQPDLRKELNECLLRLRHLADGMEPSDRMVLMNEVILRLLPERSKTIHAQAKAVANTGNPLVGLTSEQFELVRKLADSTERLSGFDKGQVGH